MIYIPPQKTRIHPQFILDPYILYIAFTVGDLKVL